MISWDLADLSGLVADFDAAPGKVARAARDVVEQTAIELRDEWRANARVTAGAHGKHYPRAIDYRMGGFASIYADVEPNEAKPQGGMSFEFGSINQPPHLDGQRALDTIAPRFMRRIESIGSFL